MARLTELKMIVSWVFSTNDIQSLTARNVIDIHHHVTVTVYK